MLKILGQTSVICIVTLVSGIIVNLVSPRAIPWFQDWDRYLEQQALEHGIFPVAAENVPRLMEEGVIILDARRREEYDKARLPGSLNMPYEQRDTVFGDYVSWLTTDLPLLIYCSGGACDEALRLAVFFRELGFEHVHILVEGLTGWRGKGFPLE